MFFRKKKYDLAGVDRDSTVSSSSSSSDSNRMSYANSTSYGNSVGGGETLSRKKELRRLSAMSQIYDGSSARSSSSTLNRFSFVPPPDLTPPEATRKQRICPVFEQGTSVRRTSSDFTGTTHEKFPSNGCSVVKSSTDICSQTKPKVGVPEKVANVSNYISSNFQQRHSFDNQQQETTQNNNNNMNFQQPPIKSLPTPGPTNIDDVIHVVSQGLNSPHQTSTNHSPVHVTTPTEDSSGGSGGSSNDNNDSNSNNNNNNITISEEPSISQSNFSLSAPSNAGQMEIKSLRQLRRLAPKSVASSQLTTKEDFSRSTTTASTASASNAAATFTTNFSASEPVIDSITATNELELKSANKKKRSVITLSSISSSSSENPPAPSQPTSPETLPSSVDSTSPQPESVPLNEPRISYPDETDAITTSTTNTLFITEIVDHPVTVNVPSDFQEYVADGSMTTNIDEECQRDARNLQVTSGCYDNTETKDEGNIKATRIYVGSCFTNNEPTTCDVDDFLPGEVNSKVDSNVYLQNNCVSRIIIKNDTIAITNAEDRNKDRNNELPSSSTNVLTTSNQDSELVLLQTFDLEKVRTDVGGELERDGDICDPQSGTNVGESSVVEENDPHVDSNDVDPLLNDIDHDINVDTEVKGHQLSTSSSSPIIDDQPANQVKPKQPATIGKFQLNAGSNNFPTKPSNNHKSKSSRDGKDEEEEIDHDDDDDGGGDDGDHEYFKRKKQETIESRNGSFRGVRNLVKSGISTFANKEESQLMKNLLEQSKGKIILFTTSMSVIRMTRDRCSDVKKILQNHRVYFEERDVYISDDNAKDLIQRFRIERLMSNSESKPNSDVSSTCGNGHRSGGSDYSKVEYEEMLTKLPRVFVEDFDLGGHEKVFKLNETGVLKKIFKEFPKVEGDITCSGCGGFRYTPCHSCHGSKRSRSNAFTEEFFALRCTKCDDNGLARCRLCNSDQTSDE